MEATFAVCCSVTLSPLVRLLPAVAQHSINLWRTSERKAEVLAGSTYHPLDLSSRSRKPTRSNGLENCMICNYFNVLEVGWHARVMRSRTLDASRPMNTHCKHSGLMTEEFRVSQFQAPFSLILRRRKLWGNLKKICGQKSKYVWRKVEHRSRRATTIKSDRRHMHKELAQR